MAETRLIDVTVAIGAKLPVKLKKKKIREIHSHNTKLRQEVPNIKPPTCFDPNRIISEDDSE
jgi:hypothetical protein